MDTVIYTDAILSEEEAHDEANAIRFKLHRGINTSERYSYAERYIEALRELSAFSQIEYGDFRNLPVDWNAKGLRRGRDEQESRLVKKVVETLEKSISIFGIRKYPKEAANELRQIKDGAAKFAEKELRHAMLRKEKPLVPYFM